MPGPLPVVAVVASAPRSTVASSPFTKPLADKVSCGSVAPSAGAVAPLAPPDLARLPVPEELTGIAAPRLFLERARAVRPDLPLSAEHGAAIAAICVHLDGLPLAIELAAARVRAFSPQTLHDRLNDPLAVLVGGPRDRGPRQQTLRGAIAATVRNGTGVHAASACWLVAPKLAQLGALSWIS